MRADAGCCSRLLQSNTRSPRFGLISETHLHERMRIIHVNGNMYDELTEFSP